MAKDTTPDLPIPRETIDQNTKHAQKIDANLRLGGRYPYTPNPKFRKGLNNPSILEEKLAKIL